MLQIIRFQSNNVQLMNKKPNIHLRQISTFRL